ncbi:MAG: porin family protein [Epsilonproteobacteria bacterium]|nr:porin family protein [Campylobacterota bacterium]
MKKLLYSVVAITCIASAGGYVESATTPVEPVIPPSVPVVGGNNFYVGGGLSFVSAREADVDLDFFDDKDGQDLLLNVMLLAGYNFNKYFSVEARASTSIAQKDFTKLTSFSLFAKPQYPVTENLTLYALLGYGYVKLDDYDGSNVDVSEGAFQWGLGASYDINNKWSVFVDYTSLGKDVDGTILTSNEADIDSINVGVIYKF